MPLSPADCDEIRATILAEPRGRNPEACCFLLEHVLGYRLKRYSRTWVEWILRYVRTINLAKRGLGKSFIKAGIDLYRILCDPNTRMVTISKTDEAATELNAPVRATLESNEILRQVFGPFVGRTKWTDSAFTVAQRTDHSFPDCTLEACGIESQLARRHFAHMGIDDGQDADRARSELLTDRDWKWMFVTARGALTDRATVNINATPYTWHDLVTRLEDWVDAKTGEARAQAFEIEDIWANGFPPPSARWMILRTPALLRDGSSIDPERLPVHDTVLDDGFVIEGISSLEGTPGFETQQMVRKPEKPDTTVKGSIFRAGWLAPWDRAPDRADMRVFQYIDPAWLSMAVAASRKKGERDPDWFVIATLGRHRRSKLIYVLDIVRKRCTPLERFTLAREEAERWDPEIVGVERTNLQLTMPGAREFYEGLRRLIGARVRFDHVNTRGGKVARAEPLALGCQQGEVVWNPELLARPELTDPQRGELSVFPFGEDCDPVVHDDQVDALSGAYSYCRRRTGDLAAFSTQSTAATAVPADAKAPPAPRGGRGLLAGAEDRAVPR